MHARTLSERFESVKSANLIEKNNTSRYNEVTFCAFARVTRENSDHVDAKSLQ